MAKIALVSNPWLQYHIIYIDAELVKLERMQKDQMAAIYVDFTFKIDETKCFIIIFNSIVVGKCEVAYKEYILLSKLKIHLLISFTQHVDMFRPFF